MVVYLTPKPYDETKFAGGVSDLMETVSLKSPDVPRKAQEK